MKQNETRNSEKTMIINGKEYTTSEVACLVAVARNCDKNNVCHTKEAFKSTTFGYDEEFAINLNKAFEKFGINADFVYLIEDLIYFKDFELDAETIKELKTLEHLVK